MKKEKIGKLTEALEGAGFEVVSLKEETKRHLLIQGCCDPYYTAESGEGQLNGGLTGIILLEIRAT
jgi:hypothetical protein